MPATITIVTVMGMELERWHFKSCSADFGTGTDWATLYNIESTQPGKGHAQALLTEAKAHYEALGMKVCGTTALNKGMKHIYDKLGIEEVHDD